MKTLVRPSSFLTFQFWSDTAPHLIVFMIFRLLQLALIGISTSSTVAQAPRLIPFQGRLTDSSGKDLPDGTRLVRFQIFGDATAGIPLWAGEVHKATVNAGLINVQLGSRNPLPVDRSDDPTRSFFDQSLYLQITVDADSNGVIDPRDPPLLPRQSILPVIVANEASNARKLAGFDWTPLFGTNSPLGSIAASKIPPKSIGTLQLAPRAWGTNAGLGDVALSLPLVRQFFHKSDGRVDLNNLLVTIETSGRPVYFTLIPELNISDDVGLASSWLGAAGPNKALVYWELWDGNVVVQRFEQYLATGGSAGQGLEWPPSAISGLLFPNAGLHTYRLRAFIPDHPTDFSTGVINGVRLVVYEL